MSGTYPPPHRTGRSWGSPPHPDVSPQSVASAFEVVSNGSPPLRSSPPNPRRASPRDSGSAKRTAGWMDDLCVRFVANLPQSESQSCERICSHVQQALYFWTDHVRRVDKSLPVLQAEDFFDEILWRCPQMCGMSAQLRDSAYTEYLIYRNQIPVRGAILLNPAMDKVVLVRESSSWSFPKGKINQGETDLEGAMREVYEETGYDLEGNGKTPLHHVDVLEHESGKHTRLYIYRDVPEDFHFKPRTQYEIQGVSWFSIADLPSIEEGPINVEEFREKARKYYRVAPFVNSIRKCIARTVVAECGEIIG